MPGATTQPLLGRLRDGTVVVSVPQDLDEDSLWRVRGDVEQLARKGASTIVVDVSRGGSITKRALLALSAIADRFGEAGVRLVVVTPHRAAVGESADGASLSAALKVERTLAEALA